VKSSDKDPLEALRLANQQIRREVPASPPALPFYDRHPEWRPRIKQTRRQLRRRLIREV
jgi:hypothetical protein